MPASWMKGTPAKSPALPDKVSLEILAAHAHELEAAGHADPALGYVIKFGPQQELDEWGQGLPLSDGDQDVIDGLVYLLGAPYQRLSDLVMAGMVTDDDVAAVKAVFPEAYKSLVKDFSVELVQAGPPLSPWAEESLAVLFQSPPEEVYKSPDPGDTGKAQQKPQSKPPGGSGTQADRRDTAVRDGSG